MLFRRHNQVKFYGLDDDSDTEADARVEQMEVQDARVGQVVDLVEGSEPK